MRILLVDDDASVIQALLAILKTFPGHEIRTATTGGEALVAAIEMGGLDLLITDVVMEPMDGFTLSEDLLARYPAARTILISGYDLSDYTDQTRNHQLLAKPIDVEALRTAMTMAGLSVPERAPVAVPTVKPASASVVRPKIISAAPVAKVVSANQPSVGAKATAVPRPSVVAAAVPVSTPRANEGPQATVASATPTPQPVPGTTAPPSNASLANSSPQEYVAMDSGEDLTGYMLGAYQLLSKLGSGRWGDTYAGMQMSIHRHVAIEVLDAVRGADPTAQARFVADARAKAAVQHPSILAVYEAGEAEDRFFYAYEYVDGQTIGELKASGHLLDEPMALKALRVAADGLSYFNVHHTPHRPPDAGSIFIGSDGHPRLANLATQLSDETLAPPEEIQALGRVMLGILPPIESLSPGLSELLKHMTQPPPDGIGTWGILLQGIRALEPKIVPTDAAKISAQDRAAIAAVELARKQQKKSLYYNLASVATLLALVGVTVWFFVFRNQQRIFDELVHIPAGEFIFANGETKDLPDFWIDKYEVTYGQYAEFVKAMEDHPTTEFDHKDQPYSKNATKHKPEHWDIYYGRARTGAPVHSTPIDLSCPVGEVDFWDAYAYAKWKGRELPTEEEWEKAARGTTGFIYPWGNDFDPKKVNSNVDFLPNNPAAKGQADGYNFWNPVDKIKSDKSPFGVVGMAGNVREWTGTWDKSKKRPIVKGGCFMSSDVRLDQRVDIEPNGVSEAIGFRTVSHTPPVKK